MDGRLFFGEWKTGRIRQGILDKKRLAVVAAVDRLRARRAYWTRALLRPVAVQPLQICQDASIIWPVAQLPVDRGRLTSLGGR